MSNVKRSISLLYGMTTFTFTGTQFHLKSSRQKHLFIKKKSIKLAAWKISGNILKSKEFQAKLLTFCLNLGERRVSNYESAWGKLFGGWTKEQINLFSCTIENIISFPVKLFEDGFKYRTINSHGSANSTFYPKIDEFQVGKYF